MPSTDPLKSNIETTSALYVGNIILNNLKTRLSHGLQNEILSAFQNSYWG